LNSVAIRRTGEKPHSDMVIGVRQKVIAVQETETERSLTLNRFPTSSTPIGVNGALGD